MTTDWICKAKRGNVDGDAAIDAVLAQCLVAFDLQPMNVLGWGGPGQILCRGLCMSTYDSPHANHGCLLLATRVADGLQVLLMGSCSLVCNKLTIGNRRTT